MLPDVFDLWQRRDNEQSRWLLSLPVCDCCGEAIQDNHAYRINSEIVCPDCMETYYRIEIEDFAE